MTKKIVIILIITLGLTVGSWFYFNQINQKMPDVKIDNTADANVNNQSNWTTYTNELYKYKISYPADEYMVENFSNQLKFVNIKSLDAKNKCEEKPEEAQDGCSITYTINYNRLAITTYQNPEKLNLADWANSGLGGEYYKGMIYNLNNPDLKTKFKEVDAIKLLEAGMGSDDGIIFARDNFVYKVDNYYGLTDTKKKIIDTFEFVE